MRALLLVVVAACSSHIGGQDAAPPPVTRGPWTLTASDGSGLALVRVDARAAIEGPLAFTELHLDFHNAEDRVREGTFAIALPPGAAVSRFAMEVDGAWQEAEVVDKTLARLAYDDALHARRDPALLEKGAGNQFTAKVFPIAANADKHLVIAYSQELDARGYQLTLRGLPRLEHVAATLLVNGQRQTLDESSWTPDRDLVADFGSTAAAVGAGTDVVASIAIGGAALAEPPAALTLLVDTSASRAHDFAGYVRAIRELVAGLAIRYGAGLPLDVIAFDQESQPIFHGEARAYDDRDLLARGALGASDLAGALEALPSGGRVVIVTDGMITAGGALDPSASPSGSASRFASGALDVSRFERVDVVLAGTQRDEGAVRSLVRGGGVFDLDRGAAPIALGLGERIPQDVPIEIAGAVWSSPRTLRSARPGTRVMVHAHLAQPATRLAVDIGDAHHVLDLVPGTPALVGRAVAAAEIDELEQQYAVKPTDELRARLSQRSVAARVVSSQTAMLVLEDDEQYARYHIDRTALADILVVGPAGVAQVHRTTLAHAPPPIDRAQLARQQAIEQARSAGILGSAMLDNIDQGRMGNLAAFEDTSYDLATVETVKPGEDLPYASTPQPAQRWNPGGDRPALTGRYEQVARALREHAAARALTLARAWHADAPEDVLALVALGEASAALGDLATAARAYGSIIDLFPTRAELRRFAGERLEHLAPALAIDSYRRAVADRPEHLDGARLLAYALVRSGDYAGAFDAILAGVDQPHASGRFAGVDRVLAEDAGMIGAAYAAHGGDKAAIAHALAARQLALATAPTTRFLLYWETDASDVDLHVFDAHGGHAWYAHKTLASGGELYADVTTGFGPECFAIPGVPTGGPYRLQVSYFARNAMGFGMGTVQIERFDGTDFTFDDRPFVIMNDKGDVDVGTVDAFSFRTSPKP